MDKPSLAVLIASKAVSKAKDKYPGSDKASTDADERAEERAIAAKDLMESMKSGDSGAFSKALDACLDMRG